jgi:hypothetical protein
MPLSTIFQLYLGGPFIDLGNRSTRRKPLTCRKSLTHFFKFVIFFLSHWRTYTKLSFYYAIANLYFRNVQLVSMDMHVIRGASVQANMDVIMWLVHVIVGQDLLDQNVMPHAHQGRKYSNLFPGLRKCSMQMSNLLWLKCWTVIKYVLFHYLNLCLSVMLDSRLCSFTWICV